MSDNVVGLFPGDAMRHTREPCEDVVAKCRELLKLAEAGHLRALVYGYVQQREDFYVGGGWECAPGASHLLLTASTYTHHRLATDYVNKGTDRPIDPNPKETA